MLCLIADIKTSVPATGGMAPRCGAYLTPGSESDAAIVIDDRAYRYECWPTLSRDDAAYMESGFQFYTALHDFGGLMLHASATVIDGQAYLFAGQCGIGKSTHAALLQSRYPQAALINDDKPALRLTEDGWMAYGTPWSGKNGININARHPVKAICLLTTRRDRNYIRPADPVHAIAGILSCTSGRGSAENVKKLAPLIDRLIRDIPIYEMDSLADADAAELAYNTMKTGRP